MTSCGDVKRLDRQDPIRHLRKQFSLIDGGQTVYMCGNSLGLMPRRAEDFVHKELVEWGEKGVEGHFGEQGGWYRYHERFRAPFAKLLGCEEREVVVMNSLTANLHLLMVSLYKPTKKRTKIVIENKAFPSDDYAVQSQAQLHGLDPKTTIYRIGDENGIFSVDDLEAYLDEHGEEVALVWLGAVNFYTGSVLDIQRITEIVHRCGAIVGFDLAHATGNVQLKLHDWSIDFAVFCTYKYLNGGPGAPGGAFIHSRHITNTSLKRLAGWWGNDPTTRFRMGTEFVPVPSADGWQLSNAPIMGMSALYASISLFDQIPLEKLWRKSKLLWKTLVKLIEESKLPGVKVLTPASSHGCQVSLQFSGGTEQAKFVQKKLQDMGVIVDVRMPDVIRISPVPMYNSYEDVWRTVDALRVVLTDPKEADRRVARHARAVKFHNLVRATTTKNFRRTFGLLLIGMGAGVLLGKFVWRK